MADAHGTPPAPNPVRPPNQGELRQLWAWLRETGRAEIYMLEEQDWFAQFWIAVFDDYITGCPGYAGKVLYLVWDGSPSYCDVFTFRGGQLAHCSSHGDCEDWYPLVPFSRSPVASIDTDRLADEALGAFWDVVTRQCPPAEPVERHDEPRALGAAAKAAVAEWVTRNLLSKADADAARQL